MKKQDHTKQKLGRRKYDAKFKASAVAMLHSGRSIADVSRTLGTNDNMLRKWKSTESFSKIEVAEQGGLEWLRRQVRQLELERDI